jgi:hypothetical protein
MFIPDPGSDFYPSRIPDPNCFHPGSQIHIKKFKYFNPKKWFLSSRKHLPFSTDSSSLSSGPTSPLHITFGFAITPPIPSGPEAGLRGRPAVEAPEIPDVCLLGVSKKKGVGISNVLASLKRRISFCVSSDGEGQKNRN